MLTNHPKLRTPALPTGTAAAPSWQLLTPGDEVSILGAGAFEIVHLSQGRAWLSSLADGAQQLADAGALRLRCGRGADRRHN